MRELLGAMQALAPALVGAEGADAGARLFARLGPGRSSLVFGWPFGARWPQTRSLSHAPEIQDLLRTSPVRDGSWCQDATFCGVGAVGDCHPARSRAPAQSSAHAPLHYQAFMDAWEWAVAICGLEVAVADWPVVAPVHYWSGERALKPLSASGFQPAEELFSKSVCVTNFWQSSKSVDASAGAVFAASSVGRVQARSLWAGLLELVAAPSEPPLANRRRLTRKRPGDQCERSVPLDQTLPQELAALADPVCQESGQLQASAVSMGSHGSQPEAQGSEPERGSVILREMVLWCREWRRAAMVQNVLHDCPRAFRRLVYSSP